MEIKRIEGCTRVLGAPQNWDESAGKCYGLPVRDAMVENMPVMISAWEPTPEELRRLNNGETIKLWIYSKSHPVVSLTVGDIE